MKSACFVIAFICCVQLSAQTWTWESPLVAGETIRVTVSDVPEGEGIYMTSYGFEGNQLIASDVGFVASGTPGTLTAPIAIQDGTSWVKVVIKDENGKVLTGDEQWVLNVKAPPQAGLVQQVIATTRYGRNMDNKAEPMASLLLLREAIAAHPAWLEEGDVLIAYYSLARQTNMDDDIAVVRTQLEGLAKKPNRASEALMVNAVRAAKGMKDTVLELSLRKKMDKQYPHSLLAQEDMYAAFGKAESIEDKIKIRNQFNARFAASKENTGMRDQMTSAIIQHHAKAEDWARVVSGVEELIDPITRQRACNSYAWPLTGESLEAEATHLDVAETLSARSLEILKGDIPPPAGQTRKEWQKTIAYFLGNNADTYALIRYKQGEYGEALDHQLVAVRENNYENAEINERYAVYLEKAGQNQALEQFLDDMFVTGKITAKMKEQHEAYWIRQASVSQVYAQYKAQLEARAKAHLEATILKKWQDDPAVSFTLKNLDGEEVSLDNYAGKVIVLDFWATWCGPCKASFPGMQMAIEKYASDHDVVFLFIDTWERGNDVEERVTKFISDHGYPFHVLMDRESKTVVDYGVEGIPTKFVIGPDQKIRFTSVGYSGNNDELVEELSMMIEFARGKTKT